MTVETEDGRTEVYGAGGSRLASFDDAGLAAMFAEFLNDVESLVATEAAEMPDADLAEQAHRYRDLAGNVLPGVTSVVGLAEADKADAFAYVARRMALDGLDHRQEWGYAADRGSRIHAHAHSFLTGAESVEARRDEHGLLDACERAIDEMHLADDLVASEAVVISRGYRCARCLVEFDWDCGCILGYGGRLDVLTTDALWDWKTGKPRRMTQTLQVNALNFADGLAVYDERGGLVRLQPFVPRERAGCIFLSEDGTYEAVEYPVARYWHGQFMRLLDAKIHNAALRASFKQRRSSD